MKEIKLTQGYVALVDDEDFEWLSQWKWHAVVHRCTVYAARNIKNDIGKKTSIKMHRQILGITDRKVEVDHKFGNGLDNTRANIRMCTSSQNKMNRGGFIGSSKYKGVSWSEQRKMWVAGIMVDKKPKIIGYYTFEEDAAMAYNSAAKAMHGEFAKYNNVNHPFIE